MMRRFVTVTVTVIFALFINVAAGDDRHLTVASGEQRAPLVELYTSEGCSSCPPADEWLSELGRAVRQRDGDDNRDGDGHQLAAVPLAFHVDYWNYLGWTDPFSKPAFTKRQRRVPANIRRGGIYTPEFVVDGFETRGGAAILRRIQNANADIAAASITVNVRRDGADDRDDDGAEIISANITVANREHTPAEAYLAVYENNITREIGGGENHGRVLNHDFVVRHWSRPIALRRGDNHAEFSVAIPADWRRANLGLAVAVLSRTSGETLQAVSTPLAELFAQ